MAAGNINSETTELEYHAAADILAPVVTSRYPRQRMVNRSDGRSMIKHANIVHWTFGFVKDGFTTLINLPWWAIVLVFCTTYISSWLVFAGLWSAIASAHGGGGGGANNTCLVNVDGFTSAFLFSVEVETTIGFGSKFVSNACHAGTFLLVVQSVAGLATDAVLLGLVFAKLTRPRNRRKSLLFSNVAVIRDVGGGERVFECRVGDIRRSQLAECHVRLRLYWLQPKSPGRQDGEVTFEQHDLDVGYESGHDRVLLLTPVTITHRISATPPDPASPLRGLTREQLRATDFEIVVILEGIVEATGLTVQALWSYTSDEVLFDREFVPMVSRGPTGGQWVVDFARIHDTMLASGSQEPPAHRQS